jgi:hypothetical protein
VGDRETVSVSGTDREIETLLVGVGDCETVSVAVTEGELETVRIGVGDRETVSVAVTEGELETVAIGDCDPDIVGVADRGDDFGIVAIGDCDREAESDEDGVRDGGSAGDNVRDKIGVGQPEEAESCKFESNDSNRSASKMGGDSVDALRYSSKKSIQKPSEA